VQYVAKGTEAGIVDASMDRSRDQKGSGSHQIQRRIGDGGPAEELGPKADRPHARHPGAFPEINVAQPNAASQALRDAGIPGIKFTAPRMGCEEVGDQGVLYFDHGGHGVLRCWFENGTGDRIV
jgi:hypothetical protein